MGKELAPARLAFLITEGEAQHMAKARFINTAGNQ